MKPVVKFLKISKTANSILGWHKEEEQRPEFGQVILEGRSC